MYHDAMRTAEAVYNDDKGDGGRPTLSAVKQRRSRHRRDETFSPNECVTHACARVILLRKTE